MTARTPAATPSGVIPSRLETLQDTFLDRILVGFVLLATVGLPVSLGRTFSSGWMPVYTLQCVVAVGILALYGCRHALPFQTKAAILMVSTLLLAIGGLSHFGLTGGGVPFLLLLQFLAVALYRPGPALAWSAASCGILALMGAGFVSGRLRHAVDVGAYTTSWPAWVTVGMLCLMISVIAFRAMATMHGQLEALLREAEAQRDRIAHLADHDALTGLPLMRLARDRLETALQRAQQGGHGVAVLFLDLDGFKSVNDRFGHRCGDRVLQQTAQRMLRAIRPGDTVARRGGDEFIVVLEGGPSPDRARAVAERLTQDIGAPLDCDGQTLRVGASVGIAVYPADGPDADSLERAADAAMYAMKATRAAQPGGASS